jgi:hypothetical protein
VKASDEVEVEDYKDLLQVERQILGEHAWTPAVL